MYRIHAELAAMIADEMDIHSVCQWRATCQETYVHASSSLQRSLITRLRAFVPRPHELIKIVTQHGALFGGEVALSYLLRQDSYQASHLEIFASNFQYDRLCDAILDDTGFQDVLNGHAFVTSSILHALRRLIAETMVLNLHNGKTIYVHQSYTPSPSAPITRAPCTALSNFVTAYGFGCSHPKLTLARRGLLADRSFLYLSPYDGRSVNRLLAHQFSLAISPTAWPEYRRQFDGDTLRSSEECWRELYICPKQGRFFGDRGSLVRFFDPLGKDEERCMEKNLAPFGCMVIWRLMSTFECDDGCEFLDDVLEHGVVSIPVLFRKDPFGDLRECVSDRRLRTSPYYRRYARPRSLSV